MSSFAVMGSRTRRALASYAAAFDRAMASWSSVPCVAKIGVVKREDTGEDPDIFDGLLGYGGFGDYRLADVKTRIVP